MMFTRKEILQTLDSEFSELQKIVFNKTDMDNNHLEALKSLILKLQDSMADNFYADAEQIEKLEDCFSLLQDSIANRSEENMEQIKKLEGCLSLLQDSIANRSEENMEQIKKLEGCFSLLQDSIANRSEENMEQIKKLEGCFSLLQDSIATQSEKNTHQIENLQDQISLLQNSTQKNTIDKENLSILVGDLLKSNQEILKLLNFNTDRQYYFNAFFNPELMKLKKHSCGDLLLCGNYGDPNLGDEWMLQTLLHFLKKHKDYHITLMLQPNRIFDTSIYAPYNVDYIHYPQTIYDYEYLADMFDIVVFGGGAIIEDEVYWVGYDYGVNICRTLVDLPIRCFAKGKSVYCIGLSTSTTISNPDYIQKLQTVISNSNCFTVRDPNSLATLNAAGIDCSNIKIINDIVYANTSLYNSMPLQQHAPDASKFRIGLVYIINSQNIQDLIQLIQKLKNDYDDKNPEITLIPFYDCWNNDVKLFKEVAQSFDFVKVAPFEFDIQKSIEIFKQQDLIISMRYHGILLAMTLELPVIAVYYDSHRHYYNKIEYLMEQFGYTMENCLPASNIINCKKISDYVIQCSDSEGIIKRLDSAQNEIKTIIKDIL